MSRPQQPAAMYEVTRPDGTVEYMQTPPPPMQPTYEELQPVDIHEALANRHRPTVVHIETDQNRTYKLYCLASDLKPGVPPSPVLGKLCETKLEDQGNAFGVCDDRGKTVILEPLISETMPAMFAWNKMHEEELPVMPTISFSSEEFERILSPSEQQRVESWETPAKKPVVASASHRMAQLEVSTQPEDVPAAKPVSTPRVDRSGGLQDLSETVIGRVADAVEVADIFNRRREAFSGARSVSERIQQVDEPAPRPARAPQSFAPLAPPLKEPEQPVVIGTKVPPMELFTPQPIQEAPVVPAPIMPKPKLARDVGYFGAKTQMPKAAAKNPEWQEMLLKLLPSAEKLGVRNLLATRRRKLGACAIAAGVVFAGVQGMHVAEWNKSGSSAAVITDSPNGKNFVWPQNGVCVDAGSYQVRGNYLRSKGGKATATVFMDAYYDSLNAGKQWFPGPTANQASFSEDIDSNWRLAACATALGAVTVNGAQVTLHLDKLTTTEKRESLVGSDMTCPDGKSNQQSGFCLHRAKVEYNGTKNQIIGGFIGPEQTQHITDIFYGTDTLSTADSLGQIAAIDSIESQSAKAIDAATLSGLTHFIHTTAKKQGVHVDIRTDGKRPSMLTGLLNQNKWKLAADPTQSQTVWLQGTNLRLRDLSHVMVSKKGTS